ncbi:MAG: hypothetical protein LBT40_02340 [Deltaproteobacteria bacterium]|jgi:hypothetical protein|nr:hypothetical protein [Deltaproteobacteria bacterium]
MRLKINEHKFNYDGKHGITFVPTRGMEAEGRVRLKLAQQLTGIHAFSCDSEEKRNG